jgi:hypothetical protein
MAYFGMHQLSDDPLSDIPDPVLLSRPVEDVVTLPSGKKIHKAVAHQNLFQSGTA